MHALVWLSAFGLYARRPAAFPFFYIEPWTKDNLPITQRFLGPISRKEAEDIAPIGERTGATGAWAAAQGTDG